MRINHTVIKAALSLVILVGFNTTALAAGQAPSGRENTLACDQNAQSRYERWVTDTPCPRVMPDMENMPAPSAFPPVQEDLDDYSDMANYTYSVFASYRDNNWEIYQKSYPWGIYDTQGSIRMTDHPASDTLPRLRPGSTDVLFVSNRTGNYELFLMDWSGANLRQITSDAAYDSQPAWSADGNKIAFVSDRDGNEEIYTMNPDGTGITRISFDSRADFSPYWSNDGAQLIWVKAVDQSNGVVYVMNADGSNAHALTPSLRYLQHPTWSLDGERIALDYDANLDGWNDLGLMNADGTNLRAVTSQWPMTDFWAGPWTGIYRKEFMFTMVSYVVYQDQLYIQSAKIGAMNLVEGGVSPFQYSKLDFYPDAAPIDLTIPESHILPLPQYIRAGIVPITISSYDPGPATIRAIRIQLRNGLYGTWQEAGAFDPNGPPTQDFSLNGGHTVYFRSQAFDFADHQEAWPLGNGDASTSIYTWQLTGNVIDIRERVVQQAVVLIEPAFDDQVNADQNGNFHRYAPTESVTVNIAKNGYGSPPPQVLSSQTDAHYTFMLPPDDELIQNGGFEQGLTSWNLSAYLPPRLEYVNVHRGNASTAFSGTGGGSNTPQLVTSSLSQTVTLPADMHKPTLSFYYYQQESFGGILTVDINDQTVLSTTHDPSAWQYQWLDLSSWLGQTVEIKFSLQSGEDQAELTSYLDDVSLGSWATPLISDITPREADAHTPITLTITGDNFIEVPEIRLNETPLTGVEWVDAQTLVINLPQGVPPGIHTVRVVNPGGQDAVLINGMKVGRFVYLPLTRK